MKTQYKLKFEKDFEEAYPNAENFEICELKIPVISLDDLIKNKKASGRHRDLADAESLEEIQRTK